MAVSCFMIPTIFKMLRLITGVDFTYIQLKKYFAPKSTCSSSFRELREVPLRGIVSTKYKQCVHPSLL